MNNTLLRWSSFAAIMLLAGASMPAHATQPARVEARNGTIIYIAPDGKRLRVVDKAGADPVLSPDGQAIAFVRGTGARGGPALWIYHVRGRSLRRLLAAHPTDDNETNLRNLNHPAFSPDGQIVYVQSAAWVTSRTLFRVDAHTGAHRFVSPTNLLLVMRDGPYAGDVIVSEHTYLRKGGTYEQLWLKRPDGTAVTKIPGTTADSEDAHPWLERHRWHAW